MHIIDAGTIAEEFGLPVPIAREIIADETQRALRSRWQPWAWLAITLPVVAWCYANTSSAERLAPLFLLAGSVLGLHFIARHLAGSAIRLAARKKADRLAGKYS